MSIIDIAGRLQSVACVLACMLLAGGVASGSPCPGDCDVNAAININELVRCVNIALGSADVSTCASCDQDGSDSVAINELVAAVRQSLEDCKQEFSEAALGVVRLDAADLSMVFDFGVVGNLPPPAPAIRSTRGTTQTGGPTGCLACPDGGQIGGYDCLPSGDGSMLVATLTDCVDSGVTRSGQIRLTVRDADFCASCEIPLGIPATQELTGYSESRDGQQIVIANTLTESFTLTGQGCRLGAPEPALDRTSTFTGTLRVTGAGSDVTVGFEALSAAVTSARDGAGLCTVSTKQNGTVRVEDHVANQRFARTAVDFVTAETERADGGRLVTLDTLDGGRLVVDCLGGATELQTLMPLAFPTGTACATAGLLQIAFNADLDPPAPVAAVRFTETGGVEFDRDFNGEFQADDSVATCRDASLSRCRVELPPTFLPETRTPTVTATPTPVIGTPTVTLTATDSPTATDTPTATATATETPTAVETGTATETPTTTPTATPTCRMSIPGGLVEDTTWTKANSPYCISGDLRVSLLRIQSGVQVLVDGPYEIEVLTSITVVGTAAEPVRFGVKDHMVAWKGLRFQNTGPDSSFSHCIIESSNRSGVTLIDAAPVPFTNCEFRNNTTEGNGGAIEAVRVTGDLEIDGCSFVGNSALNGGALHIALVPGASLNVTDSRFEANVANPNLAFSDSVGGALYLESGDGAVSHSRFVDNHTIAACFDIFLCSVTSRGGAIFIDGGGTLAIESSEFVGNQSEAYNGGDNDAEPCSFGGSSSARGGAVYVESGTVSLLNCIMSCNLTFPSGAACGPSTDGGGLYVNGGTVTVRNTTIVRNAQATGIALGAGTLSVDSSILFFNNNDGLQVGGMPEISYSDIQGGFQGTENINLQPAFAGPGCEPCELRILLGSPCIDKGNPAFNDLCFPPSLGTSRNDMGAFGGPLACELECP